MNTTTDIVCGFGTFFTTMGLLSNVPAGTSPWVELVIGIVSALVFSIVSIGTKIITSYLAKKGIISEEHKKDIDDTMEDLIDDGKINHSNDPKEIVIKEDKSDIDKTEK